MTWLSITLPGDSAYEATSKQLVDDIRRSHEAAGSPSDADVFHRRRGDGSHTYYLSPEVSKFAGELLRNANASACEVPSGVDRLVRVRL